MQNDMDQQEPTRRPIQKHEYIEIIKAELDKCMRSPIYFFKKYVKIQHPQRGEILFDLYPFQETAFNDLVNYKYNIILKSRQMGISTLTSAYALWMMIFHKNKNIIVISYNQEVAKELVIKVRYANDHLPPWLKVECVEDNRLSLKFKNGSRIKAVSTTGKSGASFAASMLIIDECALIDNAEELWTAAQPTLSTGGKCIMLSTPRGWGNFFHKMWIESEQVDGSGVGTNGFHAIKLPWDLHPDRDVEWRRIEGAKIGSPKLAAQEYDCDFLTSGDNVIEQKIIQFYKDTKVKDPAEIRGADRGLWIWQYPDYSHSYVLSADSARGDGSDFSACHVLDITTNLPTQVAEYKGSMGTKEYGNFLVSLATEYNNALLIPERENVGWATIQAIIDRNYPNLFYSSADIKYVDVSRNISNNLNHDDRKLVAGFSTNVGTRILLIEKLCQYISEIAVEIHSKRLISELETFIWKNGKAQAMEGRNDDLIMSFGIGLWVRDTALRLRLEGIELLKKSLDHISSTKTDSVPFINSRLQTPAQQAWSMATGKTSTGQHLPEDLRWLIS